MDAVDVSASSRQPQTPPPSPATRLLSALVWTSGAKWSTQLLSWATTIVVARILTPSDYGIVGMATLVMGLATLVADLGVGTAVVTQRVTDIAMLRQLNTLTILAGLGGFLLVAAAAPPIGRFFGSQHVVPVLVVLGAALVVQCAKTVPEGILVQEREFRLLAGVEAAKALAGALSTVGCALLDYGYWSLVVGYFAAAVLGTAVTLFLRPVSLETPRRAVVGPAVQVSLDVVGARFAWYSYSNADFLIAGRVLGAAPLGIYTMAWTVATAPVDKIAAILNQVSQPFFAANRDNLGALRKQFLDLTEGIALVTIPACLGLALVADDLLAVALGPRWSGAVVPLQILCLYAPLRCIAVVVSPLLLALGDSRYLLNCTAAAAVVLPFCFLLGSRLGPVGIASAWALAYPLVALPLYARVLLRIRLTKMEYLRSLRVPLLSAVGMAVGVALLRQSLSPHWHPGSRLGTQVALGAFAWVATLLVFSMPKARQLLALARATLGLPTNAS